MKRFILSVGALLLSCAMLAACGQKDNFIAVDTTPTAIAAETDATLKQPEDFQFDPMTGEFSFTATDDRMWDDSISVTTTAKDNNPNVPLRIATEYLATSARIMGGSTGAVTGKVDLPAMGWGTFRVMLNAYPAAGSGLERPEPTKITAEYGVGLTLERPEMLAMVSGNQVELIVDWFTLSDYYTQEYLPEMEFTFYSDPECTDAVRSERKRPSPPRRICRRPPRRHRAPRPPGFRGRLAACAWANSPSPASSLLLPAGSAAQHDLHSATVLPQLLPRLQCLAQAGNQLHQQLVVFLAFRTALFQPLDRNFQCVSMIHFHPPLFPILSRSLRHSVRD